MTIDSMISIASSVISLAAAIFIGVWQIKQGKRMEELATKQDIESKQRRAEYITLTRNKFLAKYQNDRDEIYLLPLCVMAAAYNSTLPYHREMYREYNLLEDEVKHAVCDYMGLSLSFPQTNGDMLISQCIRVLGKEERAIATTGEKNFLSTNAKYFYKAIKRYRREVFPVDYWMIEREILKNDSGENGRNSAKRSVSAFMEYFKFGENCGELSDVRNCEIYLVMSKCLAKRKSQGVYYRGWIPGEYYCEQLETIEDLFLCSLLCIYVYLLRPNEKGNKHE